MRTFLKRKEFLIVFTILTISSGFFVGEIFAAKTPSIIINEIMWMGSKEDNGTNKTSDEWIELYNTTSQDINIGQYEIENAGSLKKPLLTISVGEIISANGYYLISNHNRGKSLINVDVDLATTKVSLNNSYEKNGQLILKNESAIIDLVPIPSGKKWPAGENSSSKKWSMERDSDYLGWHTCDPSTISVAGLNLMKSYWDSNARKYNCGTPGAENSKKEDDNQQVKNYIGKVKINEIYPAPNTKKGETEFIEIKNLSQEEIDFSKWCVKDENEHNKKKKGHCKKISEINRNGDFHVLLGNFSLNNDSGGDSVFLYDSNDNLIDSQNYRSTKYVYSYAFDSNNKLWRWTSQSTPGSKNLFDPQQKNSQKPPPIIYSSKIRINELFPDPKEKPEKNYEYIELYNYGDEEIDLKNWELKDANILKKENGKGKKLSGIIEPKKYLAFYKTVSLNNNGDEIKLFNPDGDEVDGVAYGKAKENYAYCFNSGKWEWTPFLTPGKANRFKVKKNYSHFIHINEILPNPSGDEKLKEYIEIYNSGDRSIDLSGWVLKDSSKRGRFVFPENSLIKSENFSVIYRANFKFAMNNSGSETVYLLDPNENVVSSIFYSKAKEDVSYNFNKLELDWRWSRFLTPGRENKFNQLPRIEIRKDKKIYKNVYADFKVKINDPDKDRIKVVWDFGDGRKSYKKKTRHKYEETGKYSASLKVFDGSEEVIKKFKIKVRKFPRPKVRIVRLLPNPKGKDSELEWIEIKNKSKKEINLKNWSIATGSSGKKITNHPIYEDFFIRPGKVKKIMRDLSKFSLNNKKCRIELRYPDGKIAYKVKYKKEDGVKDDEVYEKVKGGKWKWKKIVLDVQVVENVENDENVEDNEDVEIIRDVQVVENEEEIKKFINGQSVEVSDDKKLELLIGELDAEALGNLIIALADSDIKEINNIYIFNSLAGEDKHFALKFLEKLLREINQALNNRLNLLN